MDGVVYQQTDSYEEGLNAAHNLPYVDLTKAYKADNGEIPAGTLLKLTAGEHERWVQGTDAAGLIVGVAAQASPIDTARQAVGLVRVFGPVRKAKLVAATAADGSASEAPNDAALAALEALNIYAL